MKCPKCDYLGFEPVDRCRNCGYEFSLVRAVRIPELAIRPDNHDDQNTFEDLTLVDAAAAPRSRDSYHAGQASSARDGKGAAAFSPELPLFSSPGVPDDAPLITTPSQPRQPLAVRRATPEVPRLRGEQRAGMEMRQATPMLDLEPDEVDARHGMLRRPDERIAESRWHRRRSPEAAAGEPANLIARLIAVVIDLGVLAIIDTAVVYFTVQICGLTPQDIGILPKGPMIAFLVVQNGGYLVAFTAGGQTLGKMAAGIRVVSTREDGSLNLGHSIVRTLIWVALAIPAGLGFLSACFSPDRRGLHDRCAGTRVVRAGI